MDATSDGVSTMRAYGSAIALASGGYSVYLATVGGRMTAPAWFMLALGIVVVGHGVVLLTPVASRLGAASGPLMVGYAALMLLDQAWMAWMASMAGGGMGGGMNGMGGGTSAMASGSGWNAGMVALALLMLASGAIMTARRDPMEPDGTPGE